jgi:Fur family ferric uptake transcriptional regulator
MVADGSPSSARPADWSSVRDRLHDRGLRWTPQRRTLIEVLARTDGHVTGAELVERCREIDPATIPSTVYRTLDVLEEIGMLSHSHAADGREQFHVLPVIEHGHLECRACHASWEIPADEAAELVAPLERRTGFRVDVSHLSISGTCADCLPAGSRS